MVGYFREECVPLQMSVGGATACVVKGQGSSFSRSINLGAITILLSLSKKMVIIFKILLYLLSIYEYQTHWKYQLETAGIRPPSYVVSEC